MKSKDLQKLVLSKRENGESIAKICRNLSGTVSYITVRRWCKMISESGSISLTKSTGRLSTARTQGAIEKVKDRMKRKEPVSARKLARELKISERSG